MKRSKAFELFEQRDVDGPAAQTGDRVLYNCRMFLNRGDEVRLNERQAGNLPLHRLWGEGGVTLGTESGPEPGVHLNEDSQYSHAKNGGAFRSCFPPPCSCGGGSEGLEVANMKSCAISCAIG